MSDHIDPPPKGPPEERLAERLEATGTPASSPFARLLRELGELDVAIYRAIAETPTPGYDDLRAEISYTAKTAKPKANQLSEMTFGFVGTNLLNQDIRNSVSYTKDEVLLPGASVRLFARVTY